MLHYPFFGYCFADVEDDPIANFFVTVAKNISDHSVDMVDDVLSQVDSMVTLRPDAEVGR